MKFFFDESGSFAEDPDPESLSTSVVVGLALSESVESDFNRDFAVFVDSLTEREKVNGEPKGGKLNIENRFRFCELLGRYAEHGLLIAPAFTDMAIVPKNKGALWPTSYAAHLRNVIQTAPPEDDTDELHELVDRLESLSPVQLWRIHTWALSIHLSTIEAIYRLAADRNEECWESLRFEIDVVDVRDNSVENEVFLSMIKTWESVFARQYPFMIDPDVHHDQHPIMQRYVVDDSLDIQVVFDRENFDFCDSRDSIGIQVSDIAANIIRRASRSPNNEDGALDIYVRLMDSCPYPPEKGPGFAYVSSDVTDASTVYFKYKHLVSCLEDDRNS